MSNLSDKISNLDLQIKNIENKINVLTAQKLILNSALEKAKKKHELQKVENESNSK